MPELPEVETIRRQLAKEIVGETIADVWYDRAKMLKTHPEAFINGVKGKKITGVRRRAKLLIFELAGGSFFVVHLRMSGRLLIRGKGAPPDDYIHVIFKFQGGRELRFAEVRLFGYAHYLESEKELEKILSKFGPEPLDDLDQKAFYEILRGTRRPIKIVLIDQGKISGIGNIYANDALFLAGINPEKPANEINESQAQELLKAIEGVLSEGLETEGASDQWYRNVYGGKGRYQERFKVYGKVGQPCPRCGGAIRRVELGGRGTFFCPTCQPLLG